MFRRSALSERYPPQSGSAAGGDRNISAGAVTRLEIRPGCGRAIRIGGTRADAPQSAPYRGDDAGIALRPAWLGSPKMLVTTRSVINR